MTLSADVYRTATLMIQEYGEFAPAGAFIKADQLRDIGDQIGRDVWLRIARAAEELLSDERPADSVLH
ncbi:MAG: hypothetical protein WD624_02375 [Rhodospirillales bacterium]